MKIILSKLKTLLIFVVINLMFITQSKLFAQEDSGCGDDDSHEECPLDTWVYVLVALILVLAFYNWWRKKKALRFDIS